MTETDQYSGRDESKSLARFDADHGILWLDDVPIPVRPGERTNAELLRSLVSCIRELRRLPDGAPCHLRDRELHTFAEVLDLTHCALRRDVRRELVLNKEQAGDLVAKLRRSHRAVLADS